MCKNETAKEQFFEQEQYISFVCDKIKGLHKTKPLANVQTYGCQQNVSDSERIKGMLLEMGFDFTEEPKEADFILFNTCAVRGHAEDRVFGNIGALKNIKRKKPNLIIALCGCMVQQSSVADRVKKSYPYVDLLFGTHVLHRLPEFLYRYYTTKSRVFEISAENEEIIEGVPVRRDGSFKGWLPIMYGCNNFCTYCIVPYVRGRERSRNPEDILREAKDLIAGGCKDITLLGQNVNSYGAGSEHGVRFPELLRMLNDLDGEFRIRFMTSHPKDCTEELLTAMRDCKKVCKHLHLPFQSGSNRVLNAMNRKYTKEEYLKLIAKAKELMPEITLTSDIIVGFPGETYEDFLETLDVVKQVKFLSLFTFIYSKRGGTPAATYPDPISREEKGKWFRELLTAQDKIAKENEQTLPGKTYRVLCDDVGRKDGYITGHTDTNICFDFVADKSIIGSFANVQVTLENGETIANL